MKKEVKDQTQKYTLHFILMLGRLFEWRIIIHLKSFVSVWSTAPGMSKPLMCENVYWNKKAKAGGLDPIVPGICFCAYGLTRKWV